MLNAERKMGKLFIFSLLFLVLVSPTAYSVPDRISEIFNIGCATIVDYGESTMVVPVVRRRPRHRPRRPPRGPISDGGPSQTNYSNHSTPYNEHIDPFNM
ncbi:hypothetical protein M8C21_001155 [Ambrosia artemisiifolia]|uniref:Uncharacterized protein n=1 Tax=Ambrosia artemisiifolia TaxID=4212 RepID=A0AAD5C946_AMBAR|nr:hypothetical protein M8C21_001155 [Ambrosia artemisiifolia]